MAVYGQQRKEQRHWVAAKVLGRRWLDRDIIPLRGCDWSSKRRGVALVSAGAEKYYQ